MSYARQFELRRERLARGERAIGWKLGYGSVAARERLGTDRALVGFLTGVTVLPDGGSCAIGSWQAPVLEAELAIRVDREGRVAALGAAIELADLDGPTDDVDEILLRNIFHRAVILGPADPGRRSAEVVRCRVVRDGVEVASTDDVEALNGPLDEIVAGVQETLAANGETLRAGDVVIGGSVVPPIPAEAGDWRVELPPLGTLSVRLEM
jgi:2-keto-4-pentenoate hydratase